MNTINLSRAPGSRQPTSLQMLCLVVTVPARRGPSPCVVNQPSLPGEARDAERWPRRASPETSGEGTEREGQEGQQPGRAAPAPEAALLITRREGGRASRRLIRGQSAQGPGRAAAATAGVKVHVPCGQQVLARDSLKRS